MATAAAIARMLLGLIFVVYGTNYFVPFLTLPAPSADGTALLDAFAATGYFMPFLRITQLVTGALLIADRYVALALLITAPIVLNIFLFDVFLDPRGLAMGSLLLVIQGYLGWAYRGSFSSALQQRVRPTV